MDRHQFDINARVRINSKLAGGGGWVDSRFLSYKSNRCYANTQPQFHEVHFRKDYQCLSLLGKSDSHLKPTFITLKIDAGER